MRRRTAWLGFGMLAVGLVGGQLQAQAVGSPAALGFSAERLERIDRMMREAVDSNRVPGVAVMVLRRGKVAYQGAWGWVDREAGRKMATDAVFRIASQSKAVTSVAVMMLLEEGRLTLGDPVSKWIPAFKDAKVASASDTGRVLTPVKRAITIRDLLTHTAGISYGDDSLVRDDYTAAGLGPDLGPGWYFADRTVPICEDMDRLGTLPFVAQPGEKFVYGYNTDILGCVVERVSGLSLAEFFEQRIFRPLKMQDTRFYLPPDNRGRLTAVYQASDTGVARAPDGPTGQGDYVDGPRVSYAGGAGLLSTTRDYARFLQMLLNGGTLDGVRLMGPRTVRLMVSDQIDSLYKSPGSGFGLGFEILENPGLAGQYGWVGRFGWGGAYGTNYWVDPSEGLVAVYMIQFPTAAARDLLTRFRNLVYQAIVE
ncbi:MAG: beta-lactamase family protein [Gemmatimonadota bacterium]|nr:beta-lactamase family protein [Gemmatimonadota bacterium]MDH4348742.1 beta-lactamase family protein [Gemmatimonadota bacterium]MDH5284324.1 beta-lactamase family protein [Gemmatimonadota bacterium]